MNLELQAQLAKSWLDMAEGNMRAASGLYANASRDATQMWLGMLSAASPVGSRYQVLPFAWAMNPASMALGFSGPFSGQPYWSPLGMWGNAWGGNRLPNAWLAPFTAWTPATSPIASAGAQMLADAMASSYRTAGGHAAAAVLMPFVPPAARSKWSWPSAPYPFFW